MEPAGLEYHSRTKKHADPQRGSQHMDTVLPFSIPIPGIAGTPALPGIQS
jgi:hypothetical protein